MILHPRPLLRVNTSGIEDLPATGSTNNKNETSNTKSSNNNNNNAVTAQQQQQSTALLASPSPGVVKSVWIDTSADDLIIVTERNTVHFCRLNAVSEQESDRLDVLTLHPTRETTAARRFVTRTSAKMHAGLCALTFNAEKLLIFNGSRSQANPIGAFTCAPNSLRFRESFYPIQRFEWVPQRVGCNYDTSRIYLAVVTSICIELVQVFPLAASQDTVIRKLQRFVTTTDFCTVDATSRRLSFLCINASRKGVLKFFNVTDPVAESQHSMQHSMITTTTSSNTNNRNNNNTNNNNNAQLLESSTVSSTNATPGVSAHNSPSARQPGGAGTGTGGGSSNNSTTAHHPRDPSLSMTTTSAKNNFTSNSSSSTGGTSARNNNKDNNNSDNNNKDTNSNSSVVIGGDPTIEHHLEIKIDEEALVDPQYAFREMFPDPKQKTKAPNYFIRLITIYGEHYCAVVARSEVVLYRYDSSIPYFSSRPLTERPYRAFVLNVPQADKFSMMVLDNEIIMQSLSPPFLSFVYDTACDQSTTNHIRDLELSECMRRVGGLGNSSSSSASNNNNNNNNNNNSASSSRGASPMMNGSASSPNSFLLNPMMTASSGPRLNAHSMMNFGGAGSSSGSLLHLPALATFSNNNDSSSSSSNADHQNSSSSSSNNNKGGAESESAFSRLAGLLSIPTLHIPSNSNRNIVPLKPKIPSPLDNIPLPELAGGGGIFCDTSEPVFLSLGTDFLQRLAAKGHTRLPPEQMQPGTKAAVNNNNNTNINPSVSSQKHKMINDMGNPHSSTNGCNAANVEVFLIGRNKIQNAQLNQAANSRGASPESSQDISSVAAAAAFPSSSSSSSSTTPNTVISSLLVNSSTTSLCARGGSIGRDHFRSLFSNAIKNQQSLSDIEKLLDDAVAGFILASCAVEPPISTSGMRVTGRWQLDFGSSAKRSYSTPWAMPLLSEDEVRKLERDDFEIAQQQLKNRRTSTVGGGGLPMTTENNNSRNNNHKGMFYFAATDAEEEDEKRGRRGRLESHIPLVVAGSSSASYFFSRDYHFSGSSGQAMITAPAAHLQLVIAQILDEHIRAAISMSSSSSLSQQATPTTDPRHLRYLRGVALEVLRCFRCLIIYPLQQTIVDAYLCGLDVTEEDLNNNRNNNNNTNNNSKDEPEADEQPHQSQQNNSLVDLWGLLQLISFRFLAESPQLAAKLIQVGVKTRIRQLVQSGLDMLGRLGAFHELATALLHLGDLLAAVKIACKHNLQQIASRAIIRAHQMDVEFSEKGKQCFSAASKRKMLPLVLMMLRSRGGGTINGTAVIDGSSNITNNNNQSGGLFQAVIESTLKGLQQHHYFS